MMFNSLNIQFKSYTPIYYTWDVIKIKFVFAFKLAHAPRQ